MNTSNITLFSSKHVIKVIKTGKKVAKNSEKVAKNSKMFVKTFMYDQ